MPATTAALLKEECKGIVSLGGQSLAAIRPSRAVPHLSRPRSDCYADVAQMLRKACESE